MVASESADLTQAQRNQDVEAGETTVFDDISVTFDMDRDVPCPEDGQFEFCLVISKRDGRLPDFSIDDSSETEYCRPIQCRGKDHLGDPTMTCVLSPPQSCIKYFNLTWNSFSCMTFI